MFGWFRRPPGRPALPADWQQLLPRIPHYTRLNEAQRALFLSRVERFLASKRFHGCNGLEVTDEMRALIAGMACLLVLRPKASVFPRLRSVLIYPTAFWVRHDEPDDAGLVSDDLVEQIGESWDNNRVILSWEDVEAALAGTEVNVVAHEFAHQLDDEAPGEGFPAGADPARWAAVMEREFKRLQRHRRPPVLDPYGAESPAEFFAVATEAFFQRGTELRQHHAELYELLRDYYRIETVGALV